ncbi:MAG: hypothetical protein KBC33_01850 [Candidatus Pacebacteria bacterium]|nr:hypothetical protein [Candidatus Paceibacterota bacterium]
MHQTPPEFKKLADSAELYDRSEAIGAKFGLLIDQVGELDAEIRDILNGVSESGDFIKHIMQRLEIDRGLAEKIVAEVNAAVFQTLKEQIQAQTTVEENAASVANIEKVGGFSIEKERVATESKVSAADRSQILEHLENPPVPKGAYSKSSSDNHTEPLVDHLLQNSVGQLAPKPHHEAPAPSNLPVVEETPLETPVQSVPTRPSAPQRTTQSPIQTPTAPETPKTPPPQPKKAGPDPYREMVS